MTGLLAAAALASPLAPRWEAPLLASGGYAAPSLSADRAIVLLVGPDGAAEARDARTGAVRWRQAPPEGRRWIGAEAGDDFAVLYGADGASREVYQQVVARIGDGSVLWRTDPAAGGELVVGEAGSGVARISGRETDAQALDSRTGEPLSPVFPGLELRVCPGDGGPDVIVPLPSAWVLAQLGPLAVVKRQGEGGWLLEGWAGGASPAWSRAGEALQALGEGAFQAGSALLGLDPRTGAIAWEAPIETGDCGYPRAGARRTPAGILAWSCGVVALYDDASGERLWRRESGAIPVIEGELAVNELFQPWEAGSSAPEEAVQWWSAAGEPRERAALPASGPSWATGAGLLAQMPPSRPLRWLPRGGEPGWAGEPLADGLTIDGPWIFASYSREPAAALSAEHTETRVLSLLTGELLATLPGAPWRAVLPGPDPLLLVRDPEAGVVRALGAAR